MLMMATPSVMKVMKIKNGMGRTTIIFTIIKVVLFLTTSSSSQQTIAFSPTISTTIRKQQHFRSIASSPILDSLKECAFCKFRRKEEEESNSGVPFRHGRLYNNNNHHHHHHHRRRSTKLMMQQKPFSNQNNKGLLQILNDEVSDLLLERLSQKFNGNMNNPNDNNNNNNKSLGSNNNNNNNSNDGSSSNSSNNKRNTSPSLLSSKTTDGLSKFHRNILASTTTRQRCVTGKYPLHITITENPTRKWLSSSSSTSSSSSSSPTSQSSRRRNNNNNNNNNSFLNNKKLSLKSTAGTSQMLVNGTSVDKSLASFDRYQWLDEDEQQTLHQNHTLMSIELVAEIHVKKPGYVNILSASTAGYMAEQEEMNPFWRYTDDSGGDDGMQQQQQQQQQQLDNNENRNDIMYNRNTGERIMNNNNNNNNNLQQKLQQQIQSQQNDNKERMWITGFSLTKQSGELHYIDIENGRMGSVNKRSASSIRWPNEVNYVPKPNYGISNHNDLQTTTPSNANNDHIGNDDNDDNDHINNIHQQHADTTMYEDALLVSDGFLVPGKDNGGLYVTLNPGHETSEWNVCLAGGNGVDRLLTKLENRKQQKNNNAFSTATSTATVTPTSTTTTTTTSHVADDDDGWFYHRAVWVDLTNDGRQSILTARAKRPSILKKNDNNNGSVYSGYNTSSQNESMPTKAQLVWLERPKPHRYDEVTGTPLDKDGLVFNPFEPKHTPWKLRVLDEGPDVMFSIADMDTTDDTIEVFASQFFNKKVTLHSIKRGDEPRIVWKRDIDDRCGASFSSILATLDMTHISPTRKVIDCGSTIPTLEQGDDFSHLLVTSHECTFAEEDNQSRSQDQNNKRNRRATDDDSQDSKSDEIGNTMKSATIDGGSLFSYRVPDGKDGWKTKPWIRSVISTGFRVKGQLGNFINPGAPGFCYTFYPTKHGLKEQGNRNLSRPLIAIAGDCAESAYILRPVEESRGDDPSANYAMMCEIECGATVGSIGVGYEDFCFAPQQNGYAKIYVPCYEKDKVLVFAMGNGEDEEANYDGW